MSMKFYDVELGGEGGPTRMVCVPSPTDAQAADAASKLMHPGETILSIEQVVDDGLQHTDGLPPKTQAEELSDITSGAAARD